MADPVIIIGGIPEEPVRFYDENRQLTGIDIDIIDTIFKNLNITYKVKIIDSSARLEALWQQTDDLDMVFTYSFKKNRTQYLIYPEESHITITYNFFIRKADIGKIIYENLQDLKGLTVGYTQGFSYTPEFQEAVKTGKIKVDRVVQNSLQIPKLVAGRIDIVPMPTMVALYEAVQNGHINKITYLPKPLKEKPYYNTFVKASRYPGMADLISAYDRELRRMKKNGTLKSIFAKYGIK